MSIEEQLARDIAAVAEGVVMTDSDLRKAREEVEDRIVVDRQRNRRRPRVAIAAAAVAIPVLGIAAFEVLDSPDASVPPASPVSTSAGVEEFLSGSAPTPERLEGVWRVDNGTVLMRFTSDGAVRFDDSGRLYSDPGATGTYRISGDLVTVTVDGGPAGCAGQTFSMRASLPESGAMRVVHTRPGTGDCAPESVLIDAAAPVVTDDTLWILEQVLPTDNEYLAGLDNSGAPGWKPLQADKRTLYGDWLAEGGGHVLELAPRRAYYIADESADVVDRGTWSLRGSELTLTSSAIPGGECGAGDRLVLGGLEQLDPGTLVVRGAVRQNTCGAAWTPSAWIQIPHGVRAPERD